MDVERDQEPIYRLIALHSMWRKYAVVEGDSRFLVTRILSESGTPNTLELLEKAESAQKWIGEINAKHHVIPQIERICPHADGIDLFVTMPLGMSLSTLVH